MKVSIDYQDEQPDYTATYRVTGLVTVERDGSYGGLEGIEDVVMIKIMYATAAAYVALGPHGVKTLTDAFRQRLDGDLKERIGELLYERAGEMAGDDRE